MSENNAQIGNGDLDQGQFLADLQDALAFQIENCDIYRYMCSKRDFVPARDLQQAGDEAQVPYITSNAFKESRGIYERLVTVSPDEIDYWTVSSGTTGDRSIVGRVQADMAAYRRAYRAVFVDFAGRETFDETLLFFPDPAQVIGKGGKMRQGAVEPFGIYVGYEAGDVRPSARRSYLPQWDAENNDFVVDTPALFERLRAIDTGGGTVYLGGAPVIMTSILDHHQETGEKFSLGERCKIQFGNGGWEVLQRILDVPQEQVKYELVSRLGDILGIEDLSQVDDSYGATETCAALAGHFSASQADFVFHQPPWMRLIVRNPQTLEPATEPGERGLLQIIMPYGARSFAGVAVLIDDVAELVTQDVCPECGRTGPAIRIVGRAVDASGAGQGCGAVVAT